MQWPKATLFGPKAPSPQSPAGTRSTRFAYHAALLVSDNPDDSGHNGWTDQFEDQEEPRPGFHNDRVSEFSMPLDWSQLAEWLPIGRRWFMCFGDFS